MIMKSFDVSVLFLLVLSFLASCRKGEKSFTPYNLAADSNTTEVAEDIIYDVEIINPDEDDPWMDECLQGLDREALIDFIFKGIYDKDLKVYDIFEDTRISTRKVRQMEEEGEFSRDLIGKIQFKEVWLYDTLSQRMSKKVTEISLGTQNFGPDGYLRGYDPLFRVVLP